MRAKILKFGSLFLGAALASLGSAAHAENINTSGTICQNLIAGQAGDLEHDFGVSNHNASPRLVSCAIPRSLLQAGATPIFFVNGANFGTNTTPCTLYTYSFDGMTITQAFSFTGSGTSYEQEVMFAAGGVGDFDYAQVVCTLPGSGGGVLIGVLSVQ
jgi:hypothetical protein